MRRGGEEGCSAVGTGPSLEQHCVKRFGKTLDAPSRPHLLVDLEQLLHGHLLVLRDPQRPVDAAEAAAATVLIVEQVLMLYLHKRRAGGRHGILTLAHSYIHTPARAHTHTQTHRRTHADHPPLLLPHPPPKKSVHPQFSRAVPSVNRSQISAERVKKDERRRRNIFPQPGGQRGGCHSAGSRKSKKVLEGRKEGERESLLPVSQAEM